MWTLLDHTLYEGLPLALAVLGLVLTLRYQRTIDLTAAASFALGPAVFARLLVDHWGFVSSLVLAFLACALLSGLIAILSLWLEFDGLLAGLLGSFTGYALSLWFTQGSLSISAATTPWNFLQDLDRAWLSQDVPLHPFQILALLAACVLGKLIMDRVLLSDLGTCYRALEDNTGGDSLLSTLGIDPLRLRAAGLILSNLLMCASGLIITMKDGQANAQRGFDSLLTIIASFLLGGGLLGGVVPKLLSKLSRSSISAMRPTTEALGGVFIYFFLIQAISRQNIPSSLPKLLVVLIIFGLVVAARRASIRSARELRRSNRTVAVADGGEITCDNITVHYSDGGTEHTVLHRVHLALKPGELMHLTGDNGTGKSTLLKFLGGVVDGTGVIGLPETEAGFGGFFRRSRTAFIPQDPALSTPGTMTVEETLHLFGVGPRPGFWRPWWAVPQQKQSDLTANIYLANIRKGIAVSQLSGGQRQLVALAAILLRSPLPRLVLLDEPLAHLDENHAGQCVDLIGALLARRSSIVLVQHDLDGARGDSGSGARARLSALVSRRVAIEDLSEKEALA